MKKIFSITIILFSLFACDKGEVVQEKTWETNYWQSSLDTSSSIQKLRIRNDSCTIEFKSYSMNDSSLIFIDSTSQTKTVGHNSAIDLILRNEDSLMFKATITKEFFKDSMDVEFYSQALLTGIVYEAVRSNRLRCKVYLCMAESDYCYQTDLLIFYRSDKKGKMDYWNYKLRE